MGPKHDLDALLSRLNFQAMEKRMVYWNVRRQEEVPDSQKKTLEENVFHLLRTFLGESSWSDLGKDQFSLCGGNVNSLECNTDCNTTKGN